MSANDIAAVVVSYQSASTIEECLTRLLDADGVAEVRVVDNGSCDDTMAIVQRRALTDERLRFVANPDNPGFAVACNQGAAESSAPWLAFVNPDLLVEQDTLVRLRDAAAGLGGALVGAQLHDEAGNADAAARRHDPDFVAMLQSRAARNLAIARDETRQVQPVPAISGALMLLPRDLFEKIGGFDAGYRLHAEDLDFCRRVRAAGAQVACVNTVDVLHWRGVSSRSNPLFVEWHKHRGLWRYFRKFDAAKHALPVRMLVGVMIAARLLLALLGRVSKP
ncbi:glycosyl transferase [Lysobacteraceae bacterium NML120232]|nr:glycosyl transferase [Xanthomonadaceae bacterium NML120232]